MCPKSKDRGTLRSLTASIALVQTLNDKGSKRRQLGRRLSVEQVKRSISLGDQKASRFFSARLKSTRQNEDETTQLKVSLGRKLLERVGSRVQSRCGTGYTSPKTEGDCFRDCHKHQFVDMFDGKRCRRSCSIATS